MSFSPDAVQGQPFGHSHVHVLHFSTLVKWMFSHHTKQRDRRPAAPLSPLLVDAHADTGLTVVLDGEARAPRCA